LLLGSAAEPCATQCGIICNELLLSYQYDLGVNMYKDEVIEIVKTAVDMCGDIEVFDYCGKCPLKPFCQKYNKHWG
jgi:hypothetical protein